MKESIAMLEIRKIRDENSLRYMKMSPEELAKEMDESTNRFVEKMAALGKTVNVVKGVKQ